MTIAVIESRIRKSTRRLEVNITFIISRYFPYLLSCLFQLVSNLLFHFLRQNATVRDFLVIHQVFVEVDSGNPVCQLNFLQLINRNPLRQSGCFALPNPGYATARYAPAVELSAPAESNWQ